MTYLEGFSSVFESTYHNEIQDNIIELLDWGLLEKGNYFNVTLGEVSQDNIDMSELSISKNERFTYGQAWDGFRSNWIWQSGIDYDPAPLVGTNNTIPGISGVYVDDTFYPSNTSGTYAHYVDYYNGRVVFNNPIPSGSKVQAEFSYKYINVIYANSLPWIQEVRSRSLFPTGNDPILPPEMEIQLPAIAVEMSSNRRFSPFSLGSHGNQYVYTDVTFHCIAQDDYTRNLLIDIVTFQNDKIFTLFDSNSVINSGDNPILFNGMPRTGALRYPDLVSNYPKTKMKFTNTRSQNAISINSNIFLGIVNSQIEIIGF